MTPFQEFRLWARRAPANERISATLATAVVLTLLVWVLIPGGTGSGTSPSAFPTTPYPTQQPTVTPGSGAPTGSHAGATIPGTVATGPASPLPGTAAGVTAGGAVGGAAVSGGSAGSGGTTGTSGATGAAGTGGPGGAAVGGARGCVSPPGGGTGISATQIKIAVMITNIAGGAGNTTFNVASPSVQQAAYQAAVDDINASGGIACRKIVLQFFTANPTDQQDLQQKCLDVAQWGAYALLDTGSYANSTEYTCYPQHHVAYFSGYLIQETLRRQFYPYLFAFSTYDRIYHDTVFELKNVGFFDPAHGFKKLGIMYRSCFPEEFKQVMGWLQQAGVPSSQIVSYNVGCPQTTPFASFSDLEAAVLQFKRAGVTNVTSVEFTGDFANFTNVAQQQGAHWKYGLPDDQLVTTSYGATHPDYQQINGAIAVAPNRDGEETTPGSVPTAATKRCDAIIAKHGLAPTYKQPYAVGNACDQVWMLAAAVDHAPSLQVTALATGLERAQSVDFSFPQGPNVFAGAGVTTGGQFFRLDGFTTACNCWRVLDRTFHRSTY